MLSRRQAFEHALAGGALALALAAGGCGGPQVTISLTRADALPLAPPFLRFSFPVEERDEPVEAGPFASGAIPAESFAAIPPDVSFSIDVIGCGSNVRAECEEPDSFIGRGCAGPFKLARDEARTLEVTLEPNAVGNAACPIDPAEGEGEGEGESE